MWNRPLLQTKGRLGIVIGICFSLLCVKDFTMFLPNVTTTMNAYMKIVLICLGFVAALTAARLYWNDWFPGFQKAQAIQGELDLRDWDVNSARKFTLDGTWEFYPQTLAEWDENGQPVFTGRPLYTTVPGGWDRYLSAGETVLSGGDASAGHTTAAGGSSSFGYGTYRLKVLVNPDQKVNFALNVASIRSSSALYVNGRLLGQSGRPAATEDQYVAENVPYLVAFPSDADGVIDIVIEAANYRDGRGGGLIRSLLFGNETSVYRNVRVSVSMQMAVAIVYLMHAVYALILYAIGNRDKRLLYFAVLIISSMLLMGLSTDDKIISRYVYIPYDWSFKWMYLATIAVAYALYRCLYDYIQPFLRKYVMPALMWFCAVIVPVIVVVPVAYVLQWDVVILLVVSTMYVLTIFSVLQFVLKQKTVRLLLVLSMLAFSNHFFWWIFLVAKGAKPVYYPFDLILAMVLFTCIWFKRYFQTSREAVSLAERLLKEDRLKDTFLANTSHELRNPLHVIVNITESVIQRDKHAMSAQSLRDLRLAKMTGKHLTFVLNDLLDVMRLRKNSVRLNTRDIPIRSIVQGVGDMLQYKLAGKPVRILNDIPADFPPVRADESRFVQIMFNLMDNAVKYTSEGEIRVRAAVRGWFAHISVQDSGIGMDPQTSKDIFQAYRQEEADRQTIEAGFGLGLSICKQLVELHGGSIRFTSEPGMGTTFTFSMPLAGRHADVRDDDSAGDLPEEPFGQNTMLPSLGEWTERLPAADIPSIGASQAEAAAAEETSAMNPPRVDRMRVLAVDDDPINLGLLESILPREQYELRTVTNAGAVIPLLDSQEWDLVISDVMMPHISGYALTQMIRAQYSLTELPVLLLTARSKPEDIEAGFLAGANDYVVKPIEVLEFCSRVRALTEMRKSARDRLRLEAAWLQAQIQPHFMLNTLDTIISLSDFDTPKMNVVLQAFTNFLSNKYRFHNTDELVPLAYELDVVRSYLYIEQVRFADRIVVEWDVGETLEVLVPPLSIQPLVENALEHGILPRRRGGRVRISTVEHAEAVEIVVTDDGVGMDEATKQRILSGKVGDGEHVGLWNTQQRLTRLYGSGLRIASSPEHGTTVSFVVKK